MSGAAWRNCGPILHVINIKQILIGPWSPLPPLVCYVQIGKHWQLPLNTSCIPCIQTLHSTKHSSQYWADTGQLFCWMDFKQHIACFLVLGRNQHAVVICVLYAHLDWSGHATYRPSLARQQNMRLKYELQCSILFICKSIDEYS